VLTDPSLPITNVEASISAVTLGYVRTFGLFGNTASFGFALPFLSGNISGNVVDAPTEVHRTGLGDVRLRFAYQFFGSPALTPEEFATVTRIDATTGRLSVPSGKDGFRRRSIED
jgi:hypothetical protein